MKVFISYSTKDFFKAEIICNYLENNKIECWMAPRNIDPGLEWAQSIIKGIDNCEVFLLIYSESANNSQQILRELERAVHKNLPIIPFFLSDFKMNESFEYFLSTHQWLKGYPLQLEKYLPILLENTKRLIDDANKNRNKIVTDNFKDTKFYFETYRENLISEMNNNLVLELYDKDYYEDLCIAPYFSLTDPSSQKKKIIDLESIHKYPRASIIGEPGSGKTTALRKLCMELLQRNPQTLCPVYISLAGLCQEKNTGSSIDIENYINEEVSLYGCPDIQTLKNSTGSDLILLLDGWDEVPDDNFKTLLKKYFALSHYNFIITSRPEAQRSLPFTERFEITSLNYERMKEFIRLRLKNDYETENLLNWLLINPQMMKLAEIPLNLSIITIVFQEKGNIEKINRTKLFERAFEAILNQQHHHQTTEDIILTNQITIEQIELILRNIAYSLMISGGGRFFSQKELKNAIFYVLGTYSEDIVKLLIGKLGILRDRRSGRMEFFHLWYQEFLTARYILENKMQLIDELNNKNLASILPYTVGIMDSPDRAFDVLINIQIQDIFNYCRAISEVNFSEQQYTCLIKKLFSYAESKTPKIPVRIELAKALAQIGNNALSSFYQIAKNEDNDDYSRRSCVEALTILDYNSKYFDELLINLLDTKSEGLLWHVIEQIGLKKIKEAKIKLEKYIYDENAVTAGDSIWAINEIVGIKKLTLNDSKLTDLLNCLHSYDEHLMGHALRTIGRLKIRKAITYLHEYLEIIDNPYRWIAIEAAILIDFQEALPLIKIFLLDNDLRVVAAALKGISENIITYDDEIIQKIQNLKQNNTWIPFIEGPLSNLANAVYNKIIIVSEKKVPPIIYLGRHCKTEWNLENRLQGSIDLPLCDEGIKQANSYIDYISTLGITKIVTSSAMRAKMTASIYSDKLKIPVAEMNGLRELDHGDWEGKTFSELIENANSNYTNWIENPLSVQIFGSNESISSAQQRIIESIKVIYNTYKNEKVLIITHKHIRALLLCALKGLTFDHFKEFISDDTLPILINEEDIKLLSSTNLN